MYAAFWVFVPQHEDDGGEGTDGRGQLIALGALAAGGLLLLAHLGVVSASDGPFDQIYTFKLQEAQKNLAITGHLYATSLWLMNDAAYRKLSPKQREAFDQAAKEALAYGDELSAKSEEALLGKLKEAGMQVTKPDYAPFMAKAKPAIDKLFAELWSVTTADEIANLR